MSNIPPTRSHGRLRAVESAALRELMRDAPDLVDAWRARVVTLFPEAFPGTLGLSLVGKALSEGLWSLRTIALRDFGDGRHRNVDDTPAGGGSGMVIRPDVLSAALAEAQTGAAGDWPILCMSPRGAPLDQDMAERLSLTDGVTIVCGRYEGVDQRVIDHWNMIEVSLGDFVMTGGEIAAQALIDATVRLKPRVLGNRESVEDESFSAGLLEHPQYTRPAVWNGRAIPEVLLSGHHANIADWRRAEAERLTKERRPDLWRAYLEKSGADPEEDRSSRARDTFADEHREQTRRCGG